MFSLKVVFLKLPHNKLSSQINEQLKLHYFMGANTAFQIIQRWASTAEINSF